MEKVGRKKGDGVKRYYVLVDVERDDVLVSTSFKKVCDRLERKPRAVKRLMLGGHEILRGCYLYYTAITPASKSVAVTGNLLKRENEETELKGAINDTGVKVNSALMDSGQVESPVVQVVEKPKRERKVKVEGSVPVEQTHTPVDVPVPVAAEEYDCVLMNGKSKVTVRMDTPKPAGGNELIEWRKEARAKWTKAQEEKKNLIILSPPDVESAVYDLR